MLSGKTVKLILYELLQFAALVVPIFVIMERFARLMRNVKGCDVTAYWLVVAASVAYVTSATLLVWVPLKYVILKQRRFISEVTLWRPTALAYLLLSTLPCFAILMASSKIQVDRRVKLDHFAELPVSLVLLCLIIVDVMERIRPHRLVGKSDHPGADLDMSGPVLTHLKQVSTVSAQLQAEEGQTEPPSDPPEARNGTLGRRRDLDPSPSRSPLPTWPTSTTYFYSSSSTMRPVTHTGPLRFLWRRDGRSEVFVEAFLMWLDAAELVRVAGEPSVFYSAWVIPVYVLAFLSFLRMIIVPHSSLLCLAGVALQDLPFFIIRVALMAVFGFVTPLLYPLKNILVSLTYFYFTWLTRLTVFKRHSMF